MRPDETIIFTDLDGTLFNSRGDVSPENRRSIQDYIDQGGRFAIATGREPDNALFFIRDLPQNAPAVVVNGCGVYDFQKRTYLRTWAIDDEGTVPFMKALLAEFPDMELQAYTEKGIRYCTPEETAHPQLLAMHRPCQFTNLDALGNARFLKFFMYAPEEREEALMARLREGEAAGMFRHVPGTTDVGGAITYHELLPQDVSKGSAIRWLRDQPAAAGRRILAAGDFWNDYELLQEADVAVAPENAIDEIKEICQYVTVSNNEHVLKHVIEDIVPAL